MINFVLLLRKSNNWRSLEATEAWQQRLLRSLSSNLRPDATLWGHLEAATVSESTKTAHLWTYIFDTFKKPHEIKSHCWNHFHKHSAWFKSQPDPIKGYSIWLIIANMFFFEAFSCRFWISFGRCDRNGRTDHIYHPSLPPSQKPSPRRSLLFPFFFPSFFPSSIKASYFPRETMTVMNFPRRERISDSRGGWQSNWLPRSLGHSVVIFHPLESRICHRAAVLPHEWDWLDQWKFSIQ